MGDVIGDLGLGGLVVVFLIGAAFVALAGSTLAKAGDRIADVTGLGGALVGMILLAGATSLPEIFGVVTALSAIFVVPTANNAIVRAVTAQSAILGSVTASSASCSMG